MTDWRLSNTTEDVYREALHDAIGDGDPVARKWSIDETEYSVHDDPNYDRLRVPSRDFEADDRCIRSGHCPRCYVGLQEGHCYLCGKVWAAAVLGEDRPWYHAEPPALPVKQLLADWPESPGQLALGDAA